MMLAKWNPDPAPFGNASGFDRVAVDVKRAIAERLGVTVTVGELPGGYKTGEAHDRYGVADVVTISHDGLTVSWEHGANVSTRGYRSSDVPMGPDTVVFDVRSASWDDACKYAIRGPMLNCELPDGMMSTLGEIPAEMEQVAEDYMRYAGTSVAEVTGQ